jgi:hypothetical protein
VSLTLILVLGPKILTALAAAFAAAAVVTIVVKLLTWAQVLKSCRKMRQAGSSWDTNKIVFMLQDRLKNNNYGEIVGVFDTEAEELVGDVEVFEAEELDATLREKHRENILLIAS